MIPDSTLDRRSLLRGVWMAAAMSFTPWSRASLFWHEPEPVANPLSAHLPPQSRINAAVDVYAATAMGLSQLAAMTTRCELDVAYGDDAQQKLDIYLPRAKLTDLPVFLNIHGGGWTHGYKEWMGLNAPAIVEFPAVYISVGYRLAPAYRHPAQLEDCFSALAWVHRNIGRYGGSPSRVFIGGHSAGAHLSSLIVLRRDLHARFGLPEQPVRACFPYNGIYDLRNVEVYGEREQNNPGRPLITDPRSAVQASPVVFVAGNRTPFFVIWSENDNLLIKAESSAFVAALREQPGRVEQHMLPRFDHFWTHIDQQRAQNPWTRTLRAWMTGDPHTAPVFIS